MRYSAAIFVIATMVAAPAFGGGFSVSEQSGKATGQGGAITATTSDSAAMYYNLAGLTKIKDLHLTIGASVALARHTFEQSVAGDLVSVESNNPAGIVPSLYLGYQLSDEFSVGFGFFNTWGATVYMPKNGTNSAGEKVPNPQADINRKTALKTPTASLGFGWNAGDIIEGLALGASVDVMMGSLYVYRNLYFGEDLGKVELSADAIAVGGRMGIQYDSPDSEGLSMGLSIKLPMKLAFEGNADFDMMGDSATLADYRGSLPPDGAAGGDLTLPLAINVGISDVFLEGDLRLSGEIAMVNFESYDELRLALPDGSESVSPKNWNNTVSYRIGAEYKVAEQTFIRGGYVFDTNPIPAATLNSSLIDVDRHFVTAGAGTTFAGITLDVAAMYKIPAGKRWSSTRLGGDLAEYDLEVLLVALHVGYQFDFGGGGGEEAAAEAEAE
ncbi:MAG: hypothetical protein HOI23_21895 [Deltaproteobacteria bacterium]|nr:hypothetical protein [Deltaproteobacteria bacterium]MBT6434972.1 hypothetical protein [Deltaproteobacteria bacterium]